LNKPAKKCTDFQDEIFSSDMELYIVKSKELVFVSKTLPLHAAYNPEEQSSHGIMLKKTVSYCV
jgi:hypothetical protein